MTISIVTLTILKDNNARNPRTISGLTELNPSDHRINMNRNSRHNITGINEWSFSSRKSFFPFPCSSDDVKLQRLLILLALHNRDFKASTWELSRDFHGLKTTTQYSTYALNMLPFLN
ncbi:7-cyano-7-deazaguanine synthase [Striga asiatica]|uniref:7-cyano-7-deazaguanine synthase n=1 Tax=Striga asiatica TaxID=4170 RepID=A0A5A7QIK8_STRAF|nr:7-cyano-7-deazaguanine synthase [Striga asiatica]